MKPVVFSAEMVQAIMTGRKTQTRRVAILHPRLAILRPSEYKSGDVLWVRETWRIGAWDENAGTIYVEYKADRHVSPAPVIIEDPERFERYWIQCSDDADKAGCVCDEDGQLHWGKGEAPTRWRPSIHMPKVAARIFLRVTDVRTERVQDITHADAVAEGVPSGVDGFAHLWDRLNAGRGYGWDANPLVHVYEFRLAEAEADG